MNNILSLSLVELSNAVFVSIDNLNLDSSLIMNPGDLPLLSR